MPQRSLYFCGASVCLVSSSVSPEPEEAVIPDSPLQQISLPVVSKLRRRKETHHVRYAEKSLSQSQSSALNGQSASYKEMHTLVQHSRVTLSIKHTCRCVHTESHSHTNTLNISF